MFFIALWWWMVPASAQTVSGEAVDPAGARIDAIRKTDLRVIVLDRAGKPVPRAVVRIEQQRHDFAIGFVAGETGPDAMPLDRPLWRCFNAVSLDRFTDWSVLQPDPAVEPDFSRVRAWIEAAQAIDWSVRWGPLVSEDPARNPDWLAAQLDPRKVVEDYCIRIVQTFRGEVDVFNLRTHSLDHHWLTDRCGADLPRRLHERAKAAAPRATIALQLENALTEAPLQHATAHAENLRRQFVMFDETAITQRLGGLLLQRQLSRGLERLGELAAPVTIGPIEVGGSSDAQAAENLQTLLRLLFAAESVRGIYFAGLTVAEVADPAAALLDNAGHPLLPGQIVDDLFHKEWRTDLTIAADELGNAYARVFTGTHRIEAIYPDATVARTTVYLAKNPPPGMAQHVVLFAE